MNEPRTVFDADGSPTAADAMAIIEREQARTSSQLRPNGAVFYSLWGVIWLAIGVLYFLVAQVGLADGIAGWSTAVLVIGGMVISAVVGLRSGRGVRGASSVQGTMYALSWPIAMIGLGALVGGVARLGVPDSLMGVLTPALFVFLTGVLYLVAGAVWSSRVEYVLGVWTVVVGVVSVYVALPGSPLVMGLGGGGGLLVAAVVHRAQARRRGTR